MESESMNMCSVAVRIFPNNSIVRNKIIYVNMGKVKMLPIQSENLDVQNCCFWMNTTTKLPPLVRLKMFWNFNILGKSHFVKDWS